MRLCGKSANQGPPPLLHSLPERVSDRNPRIGNQTREIAVDIGIVSRIDAATDLDVYLAVNEAPGCAGNIRG